MAAGGFTLSRDSVAGRQVVIARRATFRLPARHHTFVLVAPFKVDGSREHLDRFLEEAALYARTARGGLPVGARRSTTAVAVAVVTTVADAGGWASDRTGEADAWPVLVDVGNGRVTGGGEPAGGTVAAIVQKHVVPALGS